MSDPANVVVQNCEYYLRVVTIFQVCLKQALLDILHDPAYNGLPLNNEQHTHGLLLAFKTKDEKNLRHVLKPWQWDIICHVCTNTCAANCQRAGKTSTQDFDITIICVLLSNYLVGLLPPTNGWKRPLAPGDYSKGACGIRARDLRNKTTGHGSYLDISTKQEFDDCCSEIEKILKGLGYKDMKLFEDLKKSSLDPYVQTQMEFFSNELKTMKVELVAINCEQNALKADQNAMKVDIDVINFYQVNIKVIQDACKFHNDALEKTNAKQKTMENRQTKMEAEQTAIESESKAMSLIIENLKDKISHLEQSCDRRYIESTSVEVDKNQENLKLVSDELKKKYKKKYGAVRLSLKPRKTAFEPVTEIERNNIVVKLSLVPSKKVFEMADENEHTVEYEELSDFYYDGFKDVSETTEDNQSNMEIDEEVKEYSEIMQEKKKDSTSSSFTYKDIFESHDDYVLISGVPGCGKTTLVETILYEWSIDDLWDKEFEFAFIIYFRQLVKFRCEQNITCPKLLSHFYPGFNFSKLLHHKTLLILDGFDEFACKKDFRETPENLSPFVQAVYDLVDPNNPSIQFTRLLTSRPGSCPILFESVFKGTFEQNLRIFKVTGFDDKNIEQYIYNHLQNTDLAEEFLAKLQESNFLKNFMKIPFFCWGISYLINNKEVELNKLPVTATALYSNILLLFIRNHGLRNPAEKLLNLFQLKEFQEMIFMLSKMAWSLYFKRKLMFSVNDLKEFGDTNLLIQSGLVIKVESECGEMDQFQFMHYSFQEFLCALHVFYNFKVVSDVLSGRYVLSDNIKMMIAGLCGGKVQDSSSDMFVRSFASMKSSCFEFDSIFAELYIDSIDNMLEAFYEFQNETAKVNFSYLKICLGCEQEDSAKESRFLKRCDDHLLSIDVFNVSNFDNPSISKELKILTSIMTCCTTLECDTELFFMLNKEKYIRKMKEFGQVNSLYLHCYPMFCSSFLSHLEFDPSETTDFLANLECVKVIGLVGASCSDEQCIWFEKWLESFKQVVRNMNDTERPRSVSYYYYKHGEDLTKHRSNRISIFDDGRKFFYENIWP